MKKKEIIRFERALELFKAHGGQLRTSTALKLGIHPSTLYVLRDSGRLEMISRGVYRLKALPDIEYPDFVTIVSRAPHAIICLISALDYHHLTDEIPHYVWIAIERGKHLPKIKYPPIKIITVPKPILEQGVQEVQLDDTTVRIYSPERTIADCFKYRNKIGIDVAVQSLKEWKSKRSQYIKDLVKYAEICRVTNIIKPYIEALF